MRGLFDAVAIGVQWKLHWRRLYRAAMFLR